MFLSSSYKSIVTKAMQLIRSNFISNTMTMLREVNPCPPTLQITYA
jgi:hypothetical protein